MRKIEPTHAEIMFNLSYYGGLVQGMCICICPEKMFNECYEMEKERLTKIEYTEAEIEQQKKNNEIAMKELHKFFEEFDLFDD